MDAQQLDDLAREIGSQLPRRGVLSALGGLALLLAAPTLDGETKKKKKQKCKGGKKKCGKKCIPADQCCGTADCGSKGSCVDGACVCPSGQKACNGGCIPRASCCQNSECPPNKPCRDGVCSCPAGTRECALECIPEGNCCAQNECPGDQYCDAGTCWCANGFEPCPGNVCPTGDQCCGNADCAEGQVCDDGTCWCASAGETYCGDTCCDASSGEICNWDDDSSTCLGGGCQLIDWCNVDADSVCKDDANGYCVCITSYAPAETPACVHAYSLEESFCSDFACDDNSDCDAGYVCVAGNSSADGYCGCEGKICALLCDAEPERNTRQRAASASSTIRDVKRSRSR